MATSCEIFTCGVDLALGGHGEEGLFTSDKLDGSEDREAFAWGWCFHFGPVDPSQLKKTNKKFVKRRKFSFYSISIFKTNAIIGWYGTISIDLMLICFC